MFLILALKGGYDTFGFKIIKREMQISIWRKEQLKLRLIKS